MAEKIIKLDDRLSFDTSKRLGNGPNSIVYKGKFEEIPVAVKHIMYEHSYNAEENPKEMAEMREKKIMNKIEKDRHYNIIGYYYSFSTEDSLYLAMQLCDGNLKHYVKNQQLVSSYPPQRVNRDIASAVEYLHTKGIVHRDLKPENVFYVLRERMIERVIVGDFGLSKATCDDAYTFTGHVGTQGYIPHEIISQFATEERAGNSRIRMTVKSDIFSMGCIFYFTVTLGQSPFGLFGQKNIADKKQPDFKHLKPTEHSLKCLLETLLSHNPEERPDAHFVLCHPAFWEADTILNFLKNASDDIESKALRETNQSVIAELEDPNIVCGTEWFNRLPAHLKHHLTNFQLNRRYIYRENSDVRSALRIIRNVANHYKDFPKEAQEELEPYPDGHVDVWMRTCPTLFMHVYDKMKDIRPKLRTYDAERKTETVIQQQRHPTQSDPGSSQACKEDVLGERNKNTQLTTITASSSQVRQQREPKYHLTDDIWMRMAKKEITEGKSSEVRHFIGQNYILCVDISESMGEGSAWHQTSRFVEDFMKSLENIQEYYCDIPVYLALVTFGLKTEVVQRLTNEIPLVREAFGKLSLGGPTPMFGGIALGTATAGIPERGNGNPKLIMVTDGRPTATTLYGGPDVSNLSQQEEAKSNVIKMLQDAKDSLDFMFVPVGNPDTEFINVMEAVSGGSVYSYTDGSNILRQQISEESNCYFESKNSSLPPVGSRVIRGIDWSHENQDSKGPGTIIGHKPDGNIVWVEWDADGHKNCYSYGANGQYDVLLTDEHKRRVSKTGAIFVGCTVAPEGDKSDPRNSEKNGTVIKVLPGGGKVQVRWRDGTRGEYCFGQNNKYDVWPYDPDISSHQQPGPGEASGTSSVVTTTENDGRATTGKKKFKNKNAVMQKPRE